MNPELDKAIAEVELWLETHTSQPLDAHLETLLSAAKRLQEMEKEKERLEHSIIDISIRGAQEPSFLSVSEMQVATLKNDNINLQSKLAQAEREREELTNDCRTAMDEMQAILRELLPEFEAEESFLSAKGRLHLNRIKMVLDNDFSFVKSKLLADFKLAVEALKTHSHYGTLSNPKCPMCKALSTSSAQRISKISQIRS